MKIKTSGVFNEETSQIRNSNTGIVLPIEIKIPVNNDEYMSTSDESEDDMFADVFTNPSDVRNLDEIMESARQDNEPIVKNNMNVEKKKNKCVIPPSKLLNLI